MTTAVTDLGHYMSDVGQAARFAASKLRSCDLHSRQEAIENISLSITEASDRILTANAQDVSDFGAKGLSDAMLDRLRLDQTRLQSIADSVKAIAVQPDPLNLVQTEWTRPNGLTLRKVTVPIGVIGMIYESRPNVTVDAAALCLLSGNAVILRGGSDAVRSNRALHEAIMEGLRHSELPRDTVQLLKTQDRNAVGMMLTGLDGAIDLIIPRGGKGLVARVQSDARIPVLAHLDGLNHTYVHHSADKQMAIDVIANAKMRRTGICGATETILIDRAIASDLLPDLAARLVSLGCDLRGDTASRGLSDHVRPASETDFRTEHLAAILNIAIVDGMAVAIAHIGQYGSGHTDAIIATDQAAAQAFLRNVDSAIVMHNASTQFADGGEFGFGAEIGIATGRLHARGPVGAQHLTTYKYHVIGTGTVRA
ncbi:glutamate-5-semialdehyde dehydrogenase [Algimonas porphyrae]|uniref:Gamma-glutamyl phosphate reductase n=1 Tax=Algimonas porphyrae TaxID=1128113 RepID=A0ABQ5UY14_9PROT|nr:gamma-glutamyl phosphate reductase [Algimonas porphyrae]